MKVLITGGSKGIGLAIKKLLEKEHDVFSASRKEGYDLMTIEGIKKLVKDCPKCDVLICNMGGCGSWGKGLVHQFNEWDTVYQKNVRTHISLINYYLPNMIRNGKGRIIGIASIFGKESGGRPWFTSAKASLIALIKEYSNEYKKTGITFNTISPGYIDVGKKLPKNVPVGKPKNVASLVKEVINNDFINGSNLVIDGGYCNSF